MAETGQVIFNHLQAKKSLDLLKKLGATATEVDPAAISALNDNTKNLRNMQPYRDLLAVAIESIVGKTEERAVASLFSPGGTHALRGEFAGSGDFEVVAWLAVLPEADA